MKGHRRVVTTGICGQSERNVRNGALDCLEEADNKLSPWFEMKRNHSTTASSRSQAQILSFLKTIPDFPPLVEDVVEHTTAT